MQTSVALGSSVTASHQPIGSVGSPDYLCAMSQLTSIRLELNRCWLRIRGLEEKVAQMDLRAMAQKVCERGLLEELQRKSQETTRLNEQLASQAQAARARCNARARAAGLFDAAQTARQEQVPTAPATGGTAPATGGTAPATGGTGKGNGNGNGKGKPFEQGKGTGKGCEGPWALHVRRHGHVYGPYTIRRHGRGQGDMDVDMDVAPWRFSRTV